ncbi:Bug family tripartite tricarboxylate transporter substrate binding protein [Ramlibacter rhizophilus]|uniref:Tripartite tricarboxylate transporter substrate binding protein n=1 Tax=Ramlibacter rhizophilus TaxID=1781167 RepID=A0A4Z0C259_9BURK|nr:tripartite tricarboxylate transporter substrate binding protein [Ramlibacter rhizophilus]TFZ04914.1 tripartite tricarboxylate transporter substrate binding protein [Ramlibacter rhizophilus]
MRTWQLHRRAWLLALAAAPVLAQDPWPNRPVRIVVAYPPGGVSDSVARALAESLSQQLGVPVRVDNRAGASGALAVQAVARSTPDAYTLCFTAATALRLPGVPRLEPVAGVMRTPSLIVGTPALAADTLAQALDVARREPGRLRWATTGEGTTGYLLLQAVSRAAGVSITHIPYKGGGQQLNDALAGQFELLSTNVAPMQLDAIQGGRLKPLAVGAPSRIPGLPEVPTLAELGLPEANLVSLFGLFAPVGTPAERIERINRAVDLALRSSPLRERLPASSNLPVHGSAESFGQEVQEALSRVARGR